MLRTNDNGDQEGVCELKVLGNNGCVTASLAL